MIRSSRSLLIRFSCTALCLLASGMIASGCGEKVKDQVKNRVEKVQATVQKVRDLKEPWQKHFTEATVEQSVVTMFPYFFNYLLLHQWGLPAQGASEGRPTDTHNQFWHQKALTTASYRDGGSPNNDTMYSVAWAYVGEEPMVLVTPDMDVEDRYWTIQIASYSSDNFAYVGTRTTGQKGGAYVITPPGWKGTLPDGVTHLAEAPTKWIFLLGRTLVKGDVDVKNVHKIQEKYRLVALSDFGKDNPPRPAAPQVANLSPKLNQLFGAKGGMGNVLKQVTKESPVEFLRLATESMKLGGIPEKEREIFKASQDVLNNLNLDDPESEKVFQGYRDSGIRRGLMDVVHATKSGYGSKPKNGWFIPNRDLGRAGSTGNFLVRASTQSLYGIVANDPAEAIYYIYSDADPKQPGSQPLEGKQSYRLHFDKDELPKVKAFWSLTMYDDSNNLVENKLNRYSLGDRSPSLNYDADGGLSLMLSHEPPEDEKLVSNWLPAPGGRFYVLLRTYLPNQEMIEQKWAPPPMVPEESKASPAIQP